MYLFNANFRQIIFSEIEKVEINVRCRIANYFAEQYGVLLCLKHLLKNDSHWNLFVDKIELLFEKYESVDIKTMVFVGVLSVTSCIVLYLSPLFTNPHKGKNKGTRCPVDICSVRTEAERRQKIW